MLRMVDSGNLPKFKVKVKVKVKVKDKDKEKVKGERWKVERWWKGGGKVKDERINKG